MTNFIINKVFDNFKRRVNDWTIGKFFSNCYFSMPAFLARKKNEDKMYKCTLIHKYDNKFEREVDIKDFLKIDFLIKIHDYVEVNNIYYLFTNHLLDIKNTIIHENKLLKLIFDILEYNFDPNNNYFVVFSPEFIYYSNNKYCIDIAAFCPKYYYCKKSVRLVFDYLKNILDNNITLLSRVKQIEGETEHMEFKNENHKYEYIKNKISEDSE